MTPQELKNSILQLAIQGKLVEQRPEEGTGEELYRQIQKEKQALMKAGAIKKEKPLPPITEEDIPFDIPENWIWAYVGDIFLHNTGKAQNSSGSDNGVMRKFITTSNLYWNHFDFSKVKEMPFTEKELQRCTVKKGDLLVCEGGDCGRAAIWYFDEEVCIQNHVHRLRPYIEVSVEYFYYLFYLYKFTGKLRGRGVAIQGLSNEAIHQVICPLPPAAEQHRIVAKIEELLPYIDRYEKAWSRLEDFNKRFPVDMHKSILQMAIQGKLVEQRPEEGTGEELYQQIQAEKQKLIKAGKIKKEKPLPEISEDVIPFDIPSSWRWTRLGEIVRFQGGFAYKSTIYVPSSSNQIIRLGNVKQNCLIPEAKPVFIPDNLAKETEQYKIQVNDILVTMTGTRRKKDYFYTTLITKDNIEGKSLFLNQRVGCFKLFEGAFAPYILSVLQSEPIRDIIFTKETGTANQGNLGSEDMKMFVYIPLPPFEEQKRIVAKLEELLPLCERLK